MSYEGRWWLVTVKNHHTSLRRSKNKEETACLQSQYCLMSQCSVLSVSKHAFHRKYFSKNVWYCYKAIKKTNAAGKKYILESPGN